MAQAELELVGADRHGHRIEVTVYITSHPTQEFEISRESTLLEVMERAAELAGVALLPPKQQPLDLLRGMEGGKPGPVIEHLDETLGEYLHRHGGVAEFTIELERVFHVNTRWDVAPKEEISPREILALPRIHLDYTKYTLYLPGSTAELPLDTPIKVERGTDLEAQADGKYGGR